MLELAQICSRIENNTIVVSLYVMKDTFTENCGRLTPASYFKLRSDSFKNEQFHLNLDIFDIYVCQKSVIYFIILRKNIYHPLW